MSGPHNPNFGNMPPQPGFGNVPPQQAPQPPLGPDAYLAGIDPYPPGFNPIDVPVWDPNSPTNATRPVSAPVSAEPPRIGFAPILRSRPKGRYIHEERTRQKEKSAGELYTQRGSEQFWGSLPRLAGFMGRVAFKGTTTPPERRYPGNYRKEVGIFRRLGAGAIGAVALAPAVVFAGVRTGVRFYSNFVTQKRTFGDSFRSVVAKRGEDPHQIRGPVPAESVYTNPYPKLGGNLPTSPKQNRVNKRKARKQARQQPPQQVPPAQQAPQPQRQRRRQAQQNPTQGAPNAARSRRTPRKTGRPKQKGF